MRAAGPAPVARLLRELRDPSNQIEKGIETNGQIYIQEVRRTITAPLLSEFLHLSKLFSLLLTLYQPITAFAIVV